MRNLFDWPLALDLAILDRVYTPVAHWLHDTFGWRAYIVGRAFLVGLPVAALTMIPPPTLGETGLALLAAAFPIVYLHLPPPPPKIGFINPRRRSDRASRVLWFWWMLVWAWIELRDGKMGAEFSTDLFWFCTLSAYWFCAVTERPRPPPKAVGALAGQIL